MTDNDLNRPPATQNEALSSGQRFESGDRVSYHGQTCQFSHYVNGRAETGMAIIYHGDDRVLAEVAGLERVGTADSFDEAVCGDLDAVIEGLAGEGGREEAERLRRVAKHAGTDCLLSEGDDPDDCATHNHDPNARAMWTGRPAATEAERLRRVERTAWSDRYPEARGVVDAWPCRDCPHEYWEHQPNCRVCDCPQWRDGRESRSWLGDWLPKDEHEAEMLKLGRNMKRPAPRRYSTTPPTLDANETLNLLRDLEQRVQAVHRCGDAEQARLLLVAIKGILNREIREREQQ